MDRPNNSHIGYVCCKTNQQILFLKINNDEVLAVAAVYSTYYSSGQAGVNQLGGVFVNGRPLPGFIRRRIVELAEMGVRPCDISRQLLVSHGCVSKILSRYYDTGSVSPGSVGGTRLIPLPPLIVKKILEIKQEHPFIRAREVREILFYYRVYSENEGPSIAAINKVLKQQGSAKLKKHQPNLPEIIAPTPSLGWSRVQ